MKTPEQKMDAAIYKKRYHNQLPDIRRFRLAMLAEKKAGRWAALVRWFKT